VVDDIERRRRRDLLAAHLGAENRGDVAAVMDTFAVDGVMHYNAAAFPTPETIQAAHMYLGFDAAAPGAFREPRNLVDRESFTDADIVIEGRLCGVHQGEFLGFQPTGRAVELPFVAFYGFDEDGKLARERVVMNLGPLNPDFIPAPAGLD
jgi:hypothetical protein